MNISELITKLEQIREREGDIPVVVSCDQEMSEDGSPTSELNFITWNPEPKSLMICDNFTFSELSCGDEE